MPSSSHPVSGTEWEQALRGEVKLGNLVQVVFARVLPCKVTVFTFSILYSLDVIH